MYSDVDAFQDGYGVAVLLVARLEFAHALDGRLDDGYRVRTP